jgi:hypothetical protein
VSILKSTPRLVQRLAEHGYTIAAMPAYHKTAPGCAVAMHFSDRIGTAADGHPQFTVRGSFELGAHAGVDRGDTTRWTLNTIAYRPIRGEQTRLNLEIETFIASALSTRVLRAQTQVFEKHLCAALNDVNAMLNTLFIHDAAPETPGPTLRLEGRLIGDLFVGRSGLISVNGPRMSAHLREANRVACSWILQNVVPELCALFGAARADGKSAHEARAVHKKAPLRVAQSRSYESDAARPAVAPTLPTRTRDHDVELVPGATVPAQDARPPVGKQTSRKLARI